MKSNSESPRIIIIGASSGLGMQLAKDFASMGWKVGAAARRRNLLEELKQSNPDRIEIMSIDVTAEDASERLLTLINDVGGMDIFLYASGTGWHNPDLNEAKELNAVNVNVTGFTLLIDTAYHYFESNQRKGRIAVITSVAGTKGLGVAPAYSASKRYEWQYLEALDQLICSKKMPIGITEIRPGFIRTALIADDPNKEKLPMLMNVDSVAKNIEKAIIKGRRLITIDSRWRALCSLWKLVPRQIWRRMKVML